jgi:hypothetical protein
MDLFHMTVLQIHRQINLEMIQIQLLETRGMSSEFCDIFLSSLIWEAKKEVRVFEKKALSKA